MTTFFTLTQATHSCENIVHEVNSNVPSPKTWSQLARSDIPVGLQKDNTLPCLPGILESPMRKSKESEVFLNSGGRVKFQSFGTGGSLTDFLLSYWICLAMVELLGRNAKEPANFLSDINWAATFWWTLLGFTRRLLAASPTSLATKSLTFCTARSLSWQ